MTFKVCPRCRSWRVQKVAGVIKSYRCLHCGWIETGYIIQGIHSFPSKKPLRLLLRSSWVYVIFALVILGGGYLISAMEVTPVKYNASPDKLSLFSEKSGSAEETKSKSATTETPVIPEPPTRTAPGLPEVSSSGTERASLHQPEKLRVVANSRSKFYHLPGMRYYDKIASDRRVIFPSEEAAQQAGYRKAPR